MKIRALAALLPLLALGGCAEDDNVSIQVYAICAPPESECSFSGQCDMKTLDILALDVGVTPFYWAFVEVHNQTLNNADDSAGRPNTHDAYVDEFRVEYEVPAGAPALPSVTERVASGPSIVPAEGSSVVSVFPIPTSIGQRLAMSIPAGASAQVLAKVRLRGFFSDQNRFETAEFPLPISVCNGCLGTPACADATQAVVSVCPQAGQTPAAVNCE